MKANAPEKIYVPTAGDELHYHMTCPNNEFQESIEYTRTDAFIEKAKKWFEEHNEWFDLNGVRHCDIESFEDFVKFMKGE